LLVERVDFGATKRSGEVLNCRNGWIEFLVIVVMMVMMILVVVMMVISFMLWT
jgi:cell division protein FtsX